MSDQRCCKLSEKKREDILDAASRLFLDKGYGNVSMDEVAQKANVSKRTVYNHFASKEILFGEIVRLTWDGIAQPLLILDDKDDIRNILKSYTLNALTMLRSEKFSKMLRLVIGESGNFPELSSLYSEHGVKTILSSIEEYFIALNDKGKLKIPEPALAAQQYVGMVKESLFWPVLLGVFKQPTPERDIRVIDAAIDIIYQIYSI